MISRTACVPSILPQPSAGVPVCRHQLRNGQTLVHLHTHRWGSCRMNGDCRSGHCICNCKRAVCSLCTLACVTSTRQLLECYTVDTLPVMLTVGGLCSALQRCVLACKAASAGEGLEIQPADQVTCSNARFKYCVQARCQMFSDLLLPVTLCKLLLLLKRGLE